MRDDELRPILLLQFYTRRGEGRLGVDTGNTEPLLIPEGFTKEDVLRVCERLAASHLVDWKSVRGPAGTILAGAGEINANGILAVEKKTPSVFGVDRANAAGTAGAGYSDLRLAALERYAEHLIGGLAAVHGAPEQKDAARARLAGFLATEDGRAIFGAAVPALRKLLGALSVPARASLRD